MYTSRRFAPSLLPSLRVSCLCLSALGGALLAAGPAAAWQTQEAQPATGQPAPVSTAPAAAPPAAANPPVSSTVEVTAARQSNRIDRQSYDVKADPASTNDSVADTLNKVPSVAVDADGNVSLRGRNNVQILVDGKPSAMMQGENRAAALQALPAGDLESVEVINNPGAQFGNEGGGGPIINLVMRRERRPGGFGAINANAGTKGRYNASAFGNYTAGRVSWQGGMVGRHDRRESSGETVRERIDPVTRAAAGSVQNISGETVNDIGGFNGSVTYNLGEKDVLGASLGYNAVNGDGDNAEYYRGTRADGGIDSEYLRTTGRDNRNRNYNASLRLDHKGEAPGELLKLDLRLSGSDADSDARYASRYTVRPANAQSPVNRQEGVNDTRVIDFTGDYERPVESGIVKLGYKLARTRSVGDNLFIDIDPLTGVERVNGNRTNRFELDDTTYAVYGSYQRRIDEKWSALGGLRAEYNELDLDQVTTRIRATNHSFDLIPSAFVTYGLSDNTTIRLSYAHRIRRPNAGELNPFVIYRDELNLASGNPRLKPSDTDSLELGIETKLGKVDTNVRLYARRDTDLIQERRVLLANDVVLTTRENAGSNRSGGIEFNFSGKATEKLSLNLNGNIGYAEQTALGVAAGGDDKRSATTVSARGRINYQLDKDNTFQVMLNAQGKQLLGQGYRKPMRSADFTYRRNLNPAMSLVVNVNDVFDSQKIETVTDTELLREHSLRRFGGRALFVGLSYRFGSFGGNGQRPQGPGGPGMRMGPGGPGPM